MATVEEGSRSIDEFKIVRSPLGIDPKKIAEAVEGFDLAKYEGPKGLIAHVVRAGRLALSPSDRSKLQERRHLLRIASAALVSAVEADNWRINEFLGREYNGDGSLVVGASDINREAEPYWIGERPLIVPVTKWLALSKHPGVSLHDFLTERPDVASRVVVYTDLKV